MKPMQSLKVFLVAMALILAPAVLQPAAADALDDLRAQGQVGERFDGFAEARGGASKAARDLVKQVNAQRRQIYETQAQKQQVSVDQVGRVYANRIIKKLPKGAWVRTEQGWKQK